MSFLNTDAIIYVIDSQDDEYFEESKAQFHKLLVHPTLKNATILIFANKQYLQGAKDVNRLIQDYEFDKIKNHSPKGEETMTKISVFQLFFNYKIIDSYGYNIFEINNFLNQLNPEEDKITLKFFYFNILI